jgi:hypothetical protein
MSSRKVQGGFGWIMFAFVASAIAVLPGIAGYLHLSHRPLTRDQLTEVRGYAVKWAVEKHQTKGMMGGPSSETADLVIHSDEHRAPFSVSSSFYEEPKYFNAAAFAQDVKKGDELVFMIRKEDVLDERIPVYGLASQKAVYLNVDSAIAYDALQRQTSLFLFIGSLVLLALMLLVARLLWRDRKKRR